MKKVLAILLTMMLTIGLVGCVSADGDKTISEDEQLRIMAEDGTIFLTNY